MVAMERNGSPQGARLCWHHPCLPREWRQGSRSAIIFQHSPKDQGCPQRDWRPVMTYVQVMYWLCKAVGSVSVAGFSLSTKGPCMTIGRTLKISKWILGLEVGRWSQAGHRKKKKKPISNYLGYNSSEWSKILRASRLPIDSSMGPWRTSLCCSCVGPSALEKQEQP